MPKQADPLAIAEKLMSTLDTIDPSGDGQARYRALLAVGAITAIHVGRVTRAAFLKDCEIAYDHYNNGVIPPETQ